MVMTFLFIAAVFGLLSSIMYFQTKKSNTFFYLIFTVIRLDGRLKGIKYTLNQISKRVEITENPINL